MPADGGQEILIEQDGLKQKWEWGKEHEQTYDRNTRTQIKDIYLKHLWMLKNNPFKEQDYFIRGWTAVS